MKSRWACVTVFLGSALLFSGVGRAAEPGFMHCSVFAPKTFALDADWKDFQQATDELPSKIPGLRKVWAGKLRNPASGYGVCMEMDSADRFREYAEHPAHLEWVSIYSRVLRPAATQFEIVGR